MATDKIYIVTLRKHEDLEGFYADMASDGYKLSVKRPISRNTHYYMEEEDAVEIRKDSRVIACERHPEQLGIFPKPFGQINFEPYGVSGDFRRGSSGHQPNDKDWGKLSTAGTDVQRRKSLVSGQGWGGGGATQIVTDNYEMFNNGRHVDVVIVDQPVSRDCAEWNSPNTGMSRFVQYEWYNELNTYVSSIDDDGQTLPTGSYLPNYPLNMDNLSSHGIHVAGTVAGQWYGWATEANIYSMGILTGGGGATFAGPSTFLCFDYLRAFHRYKAVNPETGHRNPTVTNHSWGYSYDMYDNGFDLPLEPSDYQEVYWNGTTYNSGNPNPSGWNMSGLNADFGMGEYEYSWALHYASINADVEDCIQDGVVVITASGNSNCYHPNRQDDLWNNYLRLSNGYQIYAWRGSSPASLTGTDEVIAVGNISTDPEYHKASSSNYGPGITVWAPGSMILSAYNNSSGALDTKYGSPNFYKAISGTSMASPQVCGVAACLATNKHRFTNRDVIGFIEYAGKYDFMTFDSGANSGSFWMVDVNESSGTGNGYVISGTDASGAISGSNPTITVNAGDWVFIKQPSGGAYFYMTQLDGNGQYYGHHFDRDTGTTYNTAAPTLTVEKGDTLQVEIAYSNASAEPVYIKNAFTNGVGNTVQVGVNNQGASNQGSSVVWDTKDASVGTYYYCSSNTNGVGGTINVVAKGAIYNHPLYIKTVGNSSGTSDLWAENDDPGATNGAVENQGETHGQAEGYSKYIFFKTPWSQNNLTIYYQCSAHQGMYGAINIVGNANINKPGGWDDSTHSGTYLTWPDVPKNLMLTATNPRDIDGYIAGWNKQTNKGKRWHQPDHITDLGGVQNFPRTNTYFGPTPP